MPTQDHERRLDQLGNLATQNTVCERTDETDHGIGDTRRDVFLVIGTLTPGKSTLSQLRGSIFHRLGDPIANQP